MWYTKDYKLVKKSDPGRRRSLAPAFVLFYRRCLTTNSIANRMPRLLAMLFVLLGLFCAAALPAHAEDYDTVLDLSLIHISEPTRLGMISYAVFCLKKKKKKTEKKRIEEI